MGQAEEVDYVKLIDRLWAEFDGWAVSLHAPALRDILPRVDPKVRIGAWCKPWTRFKRNIRVQYAWEPVLFWTPRNAPPKRGEKWGEDAAVRDWCAVNASMKTVLVNGKKFKGVKPPDFCRWVFALLGAKPSDEFHDLFPGSGAVGEAWEEHYANTRITDSGKG